MKVTLIDYTKDAREILIFSKKTRLNMSASAFGDIMLLPEEEKERELKYVFGTIRSSLEFVDYTIMIEGVTRAFTHQLVRHRAGVSFAQQSMRTADVSDFEYLATGSCKGNILYHSTMKKISETYKSLIEVGVKPEDARGILPTNILTNILMKINLRALSDMMSSRLCSRAQGEFRDVMSEIRSEVVSVHRWADSLLACYCDDKGLCFYKNGKGCGKYPERTS